MEEDAVTASMKVSCKLTNFWRPAYFVWQKGDVNQTRGEELSVEKAKAAALVVFQQMFCGYKRAAFASP